MRIIGGTHKRRQLHPPKNLPVRPTTDMAKEALFSILNQWIEWEDTEALDLFSGTGSIAFELMSRGCPRVTAVDMNRNCVLWIKKGAAELEMNSLQVVQSDVFRMLGRSSGRTYDLIFADPPYALEKMDSLPQLVFENNWLNPEGWLVMEHPVSIDFSTHKYFVRHRKYGKVNFSFFQYSSVQHD
ncbi:MAG: 16S rRNA (guanine(966)-N(2))-methyltransferase RsmD [Bacteroidales bacterium]|nr:16S rRNA (guanine(966)-N(2))-methyltransferase RsmD [Bacteroidales bacterium]